MRQYNKIGPADLKFFQDLLGTKRAQPGDQINEDYCHDELASVKRRPEILLIPKTTEEVSAIMKYAYDHDLPVTPRGQGTGLVGGAVALYGGILLDMKIGRAHV